MARARGALVAITVAGCNPFDTGGIGTGVGVGTGDATTGTSADTSTTASEDTAVATDASSSSSDGPGSNTSSTGGDEPGQVGPFAPAVPIEELNSRFTDAHPTLRADQLEILFASDRVGIGAFDIWSSTRESVDDPWSLPISVETLNTVRGETSPELSHDGLVLTFSSDPVEMGDLDVYVSVRDDETTPWTKPFSIAELNTNGSDLAATLSADLREVFLCSLYGFETDLYRATRIDPRSAWDPPLPIEELNSGASECSPFIDASGRWLLFASSRPGGSGAQDVWVAARDGASAGFAAPLPVEGINGESDDIDPWVSPELDVIYFASVAVGGLDLFVARNR